MFGPYAGDSSDVWDARVDECRPVRAWRGQESRFPAAGYSALYGYGAQEQTAYVVFGTYSTGLVAAAEQALGRPNGEEVVGAKSKAVGRGFPAFRDGPRALDPKHQAPRLNEHRLLLKNNPTIKNGSSDLVVPISTFRTAPRGEREQP